MAQDQPDLVRKRYRTERYGHRFTVYPCLCGVLGCVKTLAVAPGVTNGTISIAVREHDQTLVQSYLDAEQAILLAKELRKMVREMTKAGGVGVMCTEQELLAVDIPLRYFCQRCFAVIIGLKRRYCDDCKRAKTREENARYRQTDAYRQSVAKSHSRPEYITHQADKCRERQECIREQSRIERAQQLAAQPFRACADCGALTVPADSRRRLCDQCKAEHRRQYQRKANARPERQAAIRECVQRYSATEYARALRHAYNTSAAGRANTARYRHSEKGKAAAARSRARYQAKMRGEHV